MLTHAVQVQTIPY